MEPHPTETAAPEVVKPRRRWWRWLLAGMLIVALGGWFGRFWLGERLAEALRGELAGQGFHVSWKSVAFVPPYGLSFKGFQVHRDGGHTESLMIWDQVTIGKGRTGWKSLHLHAAGSELVLGEGDECLRMTDLAMDLNADREGLTVEKWSGLAHGLRVEVAGAVRFAKLNALAGKPPEPSAEPATTATPSAPAVPAHKGLEGADLAFLRTVGEWMEARQTGDKEVHLAVGIHERGDGPGYLLRADLDGTDCEWRGQHFPSLGITMEWPLTGKPEPILISRLITAPEEAGQKLAVLVDLARQEVRVNAESTALHLVPVLTAAVPSLAGLLNPLATEQASHLRLTGVIPWQAGKAIQLAGWVAMDGPVELKPTTDTLIELTNFQTLFELNGQALVLRKLKTGLWGGQLGLADAKVALKTNDWAATDVRMQGIRIPQAAGSFGSHSGFSGVVDGVWHGSGGGSLASLRAAGSLHATAAVFPFPALGGLRQPSGNDGRIEFAHLQSGFSVHGQTLVLQALNGELWSGHLQLTNARVNLKDRSWQVQGAELSEARIQQLRRDLGLEDRQQQGSLHGTWQGGGGLKLTSIAGHGSLRITDEGFHRLPMLGPMSVIFAALAPAFAEETTSRLATDYALGGGILTLSHLQADSEFTEIQAGGDLNLVTQHAKLTARAKLRGIAGLPTGLLGRLLTLDGEGPFSDIQWRLRYALGLEQVAGVAKAAGGAVLGAERPGLKTATDTAKGLEEAAKGILRIPFRQRKDEEK